MFSWRRAWRGVALLLSCLLVYSRLSAPPTAVAHTAVLPPAAKHRPPPLVDLAPAASSTPPLLASAAPARHAAADVPTRWAAEREAHSDAASSHSSAPSNKVAPPSQAIPSETTPSEAVHHELAVDADTVHVALAADSHHFQALPGVILSAANRTSAPLVFHVLVPAEQVPPQRASRNPNPNPSPSPSPSPNPRPNPNPNPNPNRAGYRRHERARVLRCHPDHARRQRSGDKRTGLSEGHGAA
eukprot:scaffold37171_cov61-Phaeocystis_antarctica.AAC.1